MRFSFYISKKTFLSNILRGCLLITGRKPVHPQYA